MVFNFYLNKAVLKQGKALWQLWAYDALLWDPGMRAKPKQEGGCFQLHWQCGPQAEQEALREPGGQPSGVHAHRGKHLDRRLEVNGAQRVPRGARGSSDYMSGRLFVPWIDFLD